MFIQPFISYPMRAEKNSPKLKPRFAAEDQRSFLQDSPQARLPDWYTNEAASTRSASPLDPSYLDFFESMIEKDAYESGEPDEPRKLAKATESNLRSTEHDAPQPIKSSKSNLHPTQPMPIPNSGHVKPYFRPLKWKKENREIDQFLFAHPGQWFTFAAITEGTPVKNHHISQYLTHLNDIEDEVVKSKLAKKAVTGKRAVLVIAYKPTEEPSAQNIRWHAPNH